MAEEKDKTPPQGPVEGGSAPSFPELEEIQREVEKRLRDNKNFLERFLDEDFEDEDAEEDEVNFEEL